MGKNLSNSFDFTSSLREGEALIIVPPFTSLESSSLAAHLLQACAREAGFRLSVLYANIILAASIGEKNYMAMSGGDLERNFALLGERFFARAAYGLPALGRNVEKLEAKCASLDWDIEFSKLQRLEKKVDAWVESIASGIVSRGFKVVGCTTTFQQTSASVALLNCIKRKCRQIITIIGGANCAGEMAEGIASLGADIDFIFSGESEITFPDFLKRVKADNLPSDRIIKGQPCLNMNALPLPNYDEYFEQFERYLPGSMTEPMYIPYEASRGCWWGEKHQCKFCGQNGSMIKFRQKSPERVISELRELVDKYQPQMVIMTDTTMPYSYFQTLLPRLANEVPKLRIFYEHKANLSLEKVLALKRAGITYTQPGIEALSTSLLKRMNKGVSAPQNIALLRYAHSANIFLAWNLLYDFPGDQCHEYEETRALLPQLRHLPPPMGLFPVRVDRFSPYFEHPEYHGVSNIRPLESYADVFPSHADIRKLSYHHIADYRSTAREHPDMIDKIKREVDAWRKAWFSGEGQAPVLEVSQLSRKVFLLRDTRGLPGTQEAQFLNRHEAALALVGRRQLPSSDLQWALAHKVGVEVDGRYVPLATAKPELIQELMVELSEKQAPEHAIVDSGAEIICQ